jgi:leucine dehydrogenase
MWREPVSTSMRMRPAIPSGCATHEGLFVGHDPECGYRGIIAIHSTTLGPAVGGVRLWEYPTHRAAMNDALRLAQAMSYKCALAGLPLGGGKSVIIANRPGFDRAEALRAHGRLIDRLQGRYVAAEDAGTSPADMEVIRGETRHVVGLETGAGNPAPSTARGVLRAMQAVAYLLWDTASLDGRRVLVQGCGSVGSHLARGIAGAGGEPVLADIDLGRARGLADELACRCVSAVEIYDVPADIFAPCALGDVLTAETVARLKVRAVVGAANNPLGDPDAERCLASRGIVYVPDYVANAGGVINGFRDFSDWTPEQASAAVDAIFERTLDVLLEALREGASPGDVALRRALERMKRAGT